MRVGTAHSQHGADISFFPYRGSCAFCVVRSFVRWLVGWIADAIVAGRGRNATLFFAGSAFTFEELGEMLARESGGEPWKKIVRSEAELRADFALPMPAGAVARLGHMLAVHPKCLGWSVAQSYNGVHGIPTTPIDVIVRNALTPPSLQLRLLPLLLLSEGTLSMLHQSVSYIDACVPICIFAWSRRRGQLVDRGHMHMPRSAVVACRPRGSRTSTSRFDRSNSVHVYSKKI